MNDFEKQMEIALSDVVNRIEEMTDGTEVDIAKLLTDKFVSNHTDFETLNEMLEAATTEYYINKLS